MKLNNLNILSSLMFFTSFVLNLHIDNNDTIAFLYLLLSIIYIIIYIINKK